MRQKTKDKQDEVICLSGPKELEKEEKKSEGQPKREKETKKIMEVLYKFHDLHEIVKYEEFYEGFDVEECHVNFSKSKNRK